MNFPDLISNYMHARIDEVPLSMIDGAQHHCWA